jgi:hypothetical protein
VQPAELGFFPVAVRAELCVGERERTPLRTLQRENTPEPEEGKLEVTKGRHVGRNLEERAGMQWSVGRWWVLGVAGPGGQCFHLGSRFGLFCY